MLSHHPIDGRERGTALLTALLVLLSLSMIAMVLMTSVTTETRINSYTEREIRARGLAMAGIEEAKARITAGDVPNSLDPDMVARIFNCTSGALPTVGADTTALATMQPSGQWLNYSDATSTADVLTVRYKTDGAGSILRYDRQTNPKVQTSSGQPIFVIRSTGKVNNAKVTIEAEYINGTIQTNLKGAAIAKKQIQNQGPIFLCGYDHVLTTPNWTAINSGRNGAAGSCNEGPGTWESGSPKLGGWAGEPITMTDGANAWGQPTATLPNQASGFYAGPWECLLMTASEWWTFIGTRVGSMPANMNGLIHIDNDGTHQNQSTSVTISGGSGSGVLYIDGNFYVNGNLTYRGLIYAEKQIQMYGKIWVLGAIVSQEGIQIQTIGNGSAILYSSEAIAQAVGGMSSNMIRLAWHEY